MTRWKKTRRGRKIHYSPMKRKAFMVADSYDGTRYIRTDTELNRDSLPPDITALHIISAYDLKEARQEAKTIPRYHRYLGPKRTVGVL
jgi:hypothetical protein